MIFLDYASATPVSKAAKKAMIPYESEKFFNPSAPYLPAKHVREDYEKAKADLAHVIGAKGNDLIITSGATEANNLAFTAVPENSAVLILETEHASVLNLGKKLKAKFIKVDKNGRIDLEDFKKQLDKNVGFVSVALANNELGTIQPLAEIAELIKKEREDRLINNNPLPIVFHSDASQALNLVPISVARLGIDLLTINSAKIYGPKGVGALYVGHQVSLKPISEGGGQEKGLRSGTENVAGLIGFTAATAEINQNG
ncbi:aminotransferase class V-fold PLP-dependent enzyme, partial [Candidatus Saccharibacteria bacterium]|nr:aminotransferase class V-fold PLP-dependent enzyme [Candidatus Saccharibacteria bacterium]